MMPICRSLHSPGHRHRRFATEGSSTRKPEASLSKVTLVELWSYIVWRWFGSLNCYLGWLHCFVWCPNCYFPQNLNPKITQPPNSEEQPQNIFVHPKIFEVIIANIWKSTTTYFLQPQKFEKQPQFCLLNYQNLKAFGGWLIETKILSNYKTLKNNHNIFCSNTNIWKSSLKI